MVGLGNERYITDSYGCVGEQFLPPYIYLEVLRCLNFFSVIADVISADVDKRSVTCPMRLSK
jgi:hypothetical protein